MSILEIIDYSILLFKAYIRGQGQGSVCAAEFAGVFKGGTGDNSAATSTKGLIGKSKLVKGKYQGFSSAFWYGQRLIYEEI